MKFPFKRSNIVLIQFIFSIAVYLYLHTKKINPGKLYKFYTCTYPYLWEFSSVCQFVCIVMSSVGRHLICPGLTSLLSSVPRIVTYCIISGAQFCPCYCQRTFLLKVFFLWWTRFQQSFRIDEMVLFWALSV